MRAIKNHSLGIIAFAFVAVAFTLLQLTLSTTTAAASALKKSNRNRPAVGLKKKRSVNHREQVAVPMAGSQMMQQFQVNYNNFDNFANRQYRQNSAAYSNMPDNWDNSPFLMQTYNEPKYYQMMPHLSNGYIGTTVKNNSIYVNGLYSGQHERSHRLRVPSLTAIEAKLSLNNPDYVRYQFDARHGVYQIETRNADVLLTQRFYVHRQLRSVIVNEVRVDLLKRQSFIADMVNITRLELNYTQTQAAANSVNNHNNPNNPNRYSYYYLQNDHEDLTFEHRVIKPPTLINNHIELNDGIYYLQATLLQSELPNKRAKQVHTYYTNNPGRITVYENTTTRTFHFLQSVNTDNARARTDYEEALRMVLRDPNGLYTTHLAAWQDVWTKSGVANIADTTFSEANKDALKWAQRFYACFYNVLAAIPSMYDNQFYGVSPSGLAYGALRTEYVNRPVAAMANRPLAEGYGGHIMYNQELWVLPLVSMFNADAARSVISSRFRKGLNVDHVSVYEQAREAAQMESHEGVRYPWQQGDYGGEVSQYADARRSKIHTSASISFGVRSFLRMTHSREFLQQQFSTGDASVRGEDFLNDVARYWHDRFQLNPSTNEYELAAVSFGERPQSREVNNEAYTNYMAALTMDTYKYALHLSDKNPYDSVNANLIRDFDDRIGRVRLPYDNFKQLFLEYDNFVTSHQNEETMLPFLNYPVQKRFAYAQKKTMLDTYAAQLPNEGKNTLSYASMIVGYLELNEERKAREYMNKLEPHFNGVFQVLSEYPQSNPVMLHAQNTFHFLPGYAAIAHALIAGFSGVRVRDYQLDLVYPSQHFGGYQVESAGYPQPFASLFQAPVSGVETWNITGLAYHGGKLDLIYNVRTKSLEVFNRRPNDPAVQSDDSLEIIIYEGTAEPVTKPLRFGDAVKINLNTDTWTYADDKRRRLQSNEYADNINVLATIYSTRFSRSVKRPNNGAARFDHVGGVGTLLLMLAAVVISYTRL